MRYGVCLTREAYTSVFRIPTEGGMESLVGPEGTAVARGPTDPESPGRWFLAQCRLLPLEAPKWVLPGPVGGPKRATGRELVGLPQPKMQQDARRSWLAHWSRQAMAAEGLGTTFLHFDRFAAPLCPVSDSWGHSGAVGSMKMATEWLRPEPRGSNGVGLTAPQRGTYHITRRVRSNPHPGETDCLARPPAGRFVLPPPQDPIRPCKPIRSSVAMLGTTLAC